MGPAADRAVRRRRRSAAVSSEPVRRSTRPPAGCGRARRGTRLRVRHVESRSSKMFHGGLRYLEQLEFGLVREALRERELSLTTLAPHLVKPLQFLFPLTHRVWERPYMAAGHLPLRPDGRRQVGSGAEAPDPRGRAADGARPQAQLADRRNPLLRHRGRRRPPHHDRRPHRRALRRGRPHLDAGGRIPAGGGPGLRCARAGLGGRPHRGGARPRRHQRHRGVDRRDPGAVAAARPVPRARVARACTSWCRATGS